MNLLLSNDDGIDAPGLAALRGALEGLGDLWVVAPDGERSAQSHALTMYKPLRAEKRGVSRYAISGTPADCVYYAIHHLLQAPPSLVVSGINNGSNLGNDVFYSGTVAAAMEGCLHGIPAVAISLHRTHGEREPQWDTAAAVARRVVAQLLPQLGALPRRILFNVNVPNVPLDQLRGLVAAGLGERKYAPLVSIRTDPRGREYFWIGGDHTEFLPIEGSDGLALESGYATITPLHPDLTFRAYFPELKKWTDG